MHNEKTFIIIAPTLNKTILERIDIIELRNDIKDKYYANIATGSVRDLPASFY